MTILNPSYKHRTRVKRELRAAGVSRYGLIKQESRYLPKLIHENENIGGIIYGRFNGSSGMLVATSHRVLFLDRKPGFTNAEDISYDVVAGVTYNRQGAFAAVTLHTRLGDFGMRFVNLRAAEKFVKYIETRRLEHLNGVAEDLQQPLKPATKATPMSSQAINFLKEHGLATLSTLDRDGNVHGAVVYYVTDENNLIYIVTKTETQKTHNLLANPEVAFTIYDALEMQTLQLQGNAEIETNQTKKDFVFSQIVQPRQTSRGKQLPPVTQLKEGSFIIIQVTPTSAKFRDYGSQ